MKRPTPLHDMGTRISSEGQSGCRKMTSTARMSTKKKLNYVAFSPQANYTDQATAACRSSANFCEQRVWRSQRDGSPLPLIRFSRPDAHVYF
jgi:hypothetical protein